MKIFKREEEVPGPRKKRRKRGTVAKNTNMSKSLNYINRKKEVEDINEKNYVSVNPLPYPTHRNSYKLSEMYSPPISEWSGIVMHRK